MADAWDGIAAAYSAIADSRRVTVFPFLWKRLRDLNCRRLLDYGGGDGTFLSLWKAGRVKAATIFEPSVGLRSIARRNLSDSSISVVGRIVGLKGNNYDAVVLNAVWMSFGSQGESIRTLGKISALLRANGTLLASVTHPCFRPHRFSTFQADFKQQWYRDSGRRFQVVMGGGKHRVEFTDTHWTLEDMSSQLAAARFSIRRLWEIPDVPVNGSEVGPIPWLILEAVKSTSH